jgi:hypothetical protein
LKNAALRRSIFAGAMLSLIFLTACQGLGPDLTPGEPAGAAVKLDAGQYWVDERAGVLEVMQLPDVREAEPVVAELRTAPAWFEGAGLYRVTSDGETRLVLSAEETTLDEVMAVYDPIPAK